MIKLLIFILIIFIGSGFTDCEGQTKLPNNLPPDAEIIYKSEGGLQPSFYSVVIHGDTMKIIDQPAEKERIEWQAKLSADDLKNLYRAFVENKFDAIRPNKDMGVADGKCRSIELKFDGKQFYAVQGDGINQTKNHAERFNNIENAIESLVKKYKAVRDRSAET